MNRPLAFVFLFSALSLFACKKELEELPGVPKETSPAIQTTKTVNHKGVEVDVVIDKPEGDSLDVLMVFHGTVWYDSLVMQATNNVLNVFNNLLDSNHNMMLVSVAYPEQNLLFGDNIAHCEAALLWLKNHAGNDLNMKVKKIFLAGHSQGGYHAARLNTMHQTDGVISNGPGPLNLVFRCGLEENGQIPSGYVCDLLNQEYGLPSINPTPYFQRSLQNFTSGHKADILFVQGMQDSPIQMHLWPNFKSALENCTDCSDVEFFELPNAGHGALFQNPQAKTRFNAFIRERR
jgi:hypothetical protein